MIPLQYKFHVFSYRTMLFCFSSLFFLIYIRALRTGAAYGVTS